MSENRGKFTRDAAQAYLALEPEMQVEKISDRIWTISDGNCRTIFIEATSTVIAFDTFGTPGRARAYKKVIVRAIPGKPVQTIIYSHDHMDHCGFAEDLAPEADIIADEMCAKVIKLRQAEGQTLPGKILTGKKNEMAIDGVEFSLLNPGPTHGSGNISAWFESDKVLFSSDTILANAKYGFVPDYHLCNFVKFMRGFLELEWNIFVPGRYGMTDRAGFEKGCKYIEAIQVESQNAFAEFVPIWAFEPMKGYVMNKLNDRFGDLEGFEDHVGQTSLRIVHHYLMGGWGLEDTPEASVLLENEVEL